MREEGGVTNDLSLSLFEVGVVVVIVIVGDCCRSGGGVVDDDDESGRNSTKAFALGRGGEHALIVSKIVVDLTDCMGTALGAISGSTSIGKKFRVNSALNDGVMTVSVPWVSMRTKTGNTVKWFPLRVASHTTVLLL